jgi:proline dehydrogenase
MMDDDDLRWTLPDLDTALSRCRVRNGQGIRCILHALAEHVSSPEGAEQSLDASLECLHAIAAQRLDASISVKPTALGALADPARCRDRIMRICEEGVSAGIRIELDMEGQNLVDFTLSAAVDCGAREPAPSVALQAYLDRTPDDLAKAMDAGIRVRIVKGAYLGDTDDFFAIERRFLTLCRQCIERSVPFSIGTHDPDLISWITRILPDIRDYVEFGFLMGLADETKQRLVGDGWQVAEYIPYGTGGDPYVFRRERYLEALSRQDREPAP